MTAPDPVWLGSKGGAGVYQTIIAQMPPHRRYIEAFLGSGAVMRRKAPAERSIGIDLDPAALDVFQAARPPYPVETLQACAIDWIDRQDLTPADLIYADPPYLPETRDSRHGYACELTRADHARLLDVLRQCKARVIVSGYPSQLYSDTLHDWRTLQFQAMTRGGVRTEQIWMNYPAGAVAWHTHAGRDRIDRQRIKRKAQRWADRYAACPPGERLAILAAILETHNGNR